MTSQDFLSRVMMLVPVLLSLTVHEFAHAWSANKLGDDTAERMGRLTLNPLAHIDFIGTLLLPLLGIPFGWAKPVPVNPVRFDRRIRMSTGMMLTAAAGPLSNVVLAVASTVIYGLLFRWAEGWLGANEGVAILLQSFIGVNVGLAVFNLIPIPPLDGSRIADGLMPMSLRPLWESFTRLAPFLLLGVIFFGRALVAGPSSFAIGLLVQLLQAIAV